MSTRQVPLADRTVFFDHGAQYFTARDPRFRAQLDQWIDRGLAAPWPNAGPEAFVGTPMMCSPLAALAQATGVTFAKRVDQIVKTAQGWRLVGEALEAGPYDAVVIAVPAEQSAVLLDETAPDFAAIARSSPSHPCWTTMISLSAPVEGLPPITRPSTGPLAWIANNTTKPGRAPDSAWVLQSTADWSRENIDLSPETIAERMFAAWQEIVSVRLPAPALMRAHLWRYARSTGTGDTCLWSPQNRIGVCGDWLIGARVEAAWLSGWRLAEAIRAHGEV